MCFSSPAAPAPAPAPVVATAQDPVIQRSLDSERKRRAMQVGKQSTVLTGPQGTDAAITGTPSTPAKSMLGA